MATIALGASATALVPTNKFATLVSPPVAAARTDSQNAALKALSVWRDERVTHLLARKVPDTVGHAFLSDRTLVRYLVAFHWDTAKAQKALEATCAWRDTMLPVSLHCDACITSERTHCFIRCGYDRWRRPILYACPARCETVQPDVVMRHVLSEMEEAFADDDVDEAVRGEWVWIADMRASSLFGVGMSMGREIVNTFTYHCPERLGLMIIIDMPTIVEWTYNALKMFMDPVTVRKMLILRSATDLKDAFHALAEPQTAEWLIDAAVTMPPKPGHLPPLLPADAPEPFHRRAQRGEQLRVATPRHERQAARVGGDAATASGGASATPTSPGTRMRTPGAAEA